MRSGWIWGVAVVLGLLGPATATAAGLDGSAPFLCAVVQALECEPDGKCERTTPEEMNLPAFIRVDPKAKTISGQGGRTAPVHDMASVEGKLVMHGGQHGRGWSAVVAQETGKMSVSVVDGAAIFVIFGVCTAP